MGLREDILNRADCAGAIEARDVFALAAIVSAGRSIMQSRFVTARTVLAECQDGASILSALEAAASSNGAVKWAVKFLGQDSGLDVGNHVTQEMIDQLAAAGVLSSAQADQLKSLALLPAPISPLEVAAAMFNDDGSLK